MRLSARRLPMALVIVRASARHRRSRLALAGAAVTLASSLAVALVGLDATRDRFAAELAVYGANLFVVPRVGSTLAASTLAPLASLAAENRIVAYAPSRLLVADVDGRRAVVVGVPWAAARVLHAAWPVEGAWPDRAGAALVGANVAAKLGRVAGDTVRLRAPRAGTLRVAGVVRTGGPEDDRVFVDLADAAALDGRPDALSLVHVRVPRVEALAGVAAALARALPDADVRTPLQAARATETVLARLARLLAVVAGAALVASALAVFSVVAAGAVERGHEIAVMKALGASTRALGGTVAAEVALVGVGGGLAGCALGLALTEAIAWHVFRAWVVPGPLALLAGATVGVGVTLLASLGPLRRLVRVAPAAVLRGE